MVDPLPPLIKYESFRSHSGLELSWKIDADALSDDTIAEIAMIVRDKLWFSRVIGVPRGGLRLAAALEPYCESGGPILIVDDVLTTGRSMEEARRTSYGNIGVVIFARGPCPNWVMPIFTVSDWVQSPRSELRDG